MSTERQAEEIRVEFFGRHVAGRAWGPTEGTPVLALHGWLDNAASFDALAPLLPESLRLIAIDLPGHGHSAHRHAGASMYFANWVREVFAIADALELEQFAMLGHSMGGAISSLCAGALPARITRLALIEGLGPMSSPEDSAPEMLERHLTQVRHSTKDLRPWSSIEDAAKVRATQTHAPLEPASALRLVERGMAPARDGEGYTWRHDSRLRMVSPMRLTEGQVLAFLRRIAAPTLLVQAEDGWPYPEDVFRERIAAVRDITVLHKPGRHHLHLDAPEVLADEIGAFLTAPPREA